MNVQRRLPRLLKLSLIAGLWAALALHVGGCTAICFGVGAVADAHKGKGGAGLLSTVKAGRSVTLQLRDGRRLKGRFAGWSHDSAAAIAATDSVSLRRMNVRLATGHGEIAVPSDSIAKVSISVSRGKITGLAIGLSLDALVIWSIVDSLSHVDFFAPGGSLQ